jgi:hypothetical protein
MAIRTHTITVNATGANGAATGTSISSQPVNGVVRGVHITYGTSPNANTVVTLRDRGTGSTIVAVTGNTAGWFYPLSEAHDNAGAGITGEYVAPVIDDLATVGVATANAGTITIKLLVDTS